MTSSDPNHLIAKSKNPPKSNRYYKRLPKFFNLLKTEAIVGKLVEEERLLWQINNNTMLYMISFATETPIKTCNMSLAWEPPYNIMI